MNNYSFFMYLPVTRNITTIIARDSYKWLKKTGLSDIYN
jgi:hypothetical protein